MVVVITTFTWASVRVTWAISALMLLTNRMLPEIPCAVKDGLVQRWSRSKFFLAAPQMDSSVSPKLPVRIAVILRPMMMIHHSRPSMDLAILQEAIVSAQGSP